MSSPNNAWVVIRSSLDPVSSELMRAALDADGITSRQRNEMLGSMLPLHSAAFGGFEIEVRAEDVVAARARLAMYDESQLAAPDDADEPDVEAKRDAETRDGDGAMRRAATAAVLGLVMCFGVGGVVALVMVAANGDAPLSDKGRTFKSIAVVAGLAGVALALAVTVLWADAP